MYFGIFPMSSSRIGLKYLKYFGAANPRAQPGSAKVADIGVCVCVYIYIYIYIYIFVRRTQNLALHST